MERVNCTTLLTDGWTVVHNALDRSLSLKLAEEAEKLQVAGLLSNHTFEFSGQGGKRLKFEHDGRRYADLDKEKIRSEVRTVAPTLAEFASGHAYDFARRMAQTIPDLSLSGAECSVQVKLQLTQGRHGAAPCHYDTSDSAPSRQITLLIYLSDGWEMDKHGGALELIPFLGRPVQVDPQFNRMVAFLADRVLHRSMVPAGEGLERHRWVLTVWFDGDCVDRVLPGSRWPPLLQRLVAPALYATEYNNALLESLPNGEARDALVAAHRVEAENLEQDDQLSEIIGTLRDVIAEMEADSDAADDTGHIEILSERPLCEGTQRTKILF